RPLDSNTPFSLPKRGVRKMRCHLVFKTPFYEKRNVVSLDYFLYLCTMNKKRELYFFKNYFEDFYEEQTDKVKKKIIWTLKVFEEMDRIPDTYLKHLKNTARIYEIRVQVGNNIFRIFCFFDLHNIVVISHRFQKKTQKTPKQQIERGEQIKKEYY